MHQFIDMSEEKLGDILVLKLHGRLDAITSPDAEKKVEDYINKGQNKLLLNFEDVDYLSSAGMRMLLGTSRKLQKNEGKLVVCSLAPNILDVLTMSGFDQLLDLSQNQQEALQKLKS